MKYANKKSFLVLLKLSWEKLNKQSKEKNVCQKWDLNPKIEQGTKKKKKEKYVRSGI